MFRTLHAAVFVGCCGMGDWVLGRFMVGRELGRF